jgi:hypothetical protein
MTSGARSCVNSPGRLTTTIIGVMTMAKSKSTPRRESAALRNGAAAPNPGIAAPPERFPETADLKIVCAKSIVQAVVAAHDAGSLEDENYDIHYPLSLVVQLLEHAADQLDKQALKEAMQS